MALTNIADEINYNTRIITSGKDRVEQAIISKGGTVYKSGTVPTFGELAVGVSTIESGGGGGGGGTIVVEEIASAGNGAIPIEATALENINQYDAVKVLHGKGTTQFMGDVLLPKTAQKSTGKTTLIYEMPTPFNTACYMPTFISELGTILCVHGSDNLYYPFKKTDEGYVQLKVDGEYKELYVGQDNQNFHYNSMIAYDEAYDLLYTIKDIRYIAVYVLEGDNLASKHVYDYGFTTTITTRKYLSNIVCKNKNVFFNYVVTGVSGGRPSGITDVMVYQMIYNSDTQKLESKGTIIPASGDYDNFGIADIAYPDGNTIYLALRNYYRHGSPTSTGYYVCKLVLNSDGVYSKTAQFFIQPNSGVATSNFTINYSGGKFFVISSGKIYQYLIDHETFTYQLLDNTQFFLDDTTVFNPDKIQSIRQIKGGRYLFCYSSDSTLEDSKRAQLLEYQFGDEEAGTASGYKLIAYPQEDFVPAVSALTGQYSFPYNPIFNLAKDDCMIFTTDTGEAYLYKPIKDGGSYLVQKSSNILSNEANLYGFGIAMENIALGEGGKTSLNVIRNF